jgi:hypothetical protein
VNQEAPRTPEPYLNRVGTRADGPRTSQAKMDRSATERPKRPILGCWVYVSIKTRTSAMAARTGRSRTVQERKSSLRYPLL